MSPDLKRGTSTHYRTDGSFYWPPTGDIVTRLNRVSFRHSEELLPGVFDPDTREPLTRIDTTGDEFVGERVLVFNLKTGIIKQLQLVGKSASHHQFGGVYRMSEESLGILVSPQIPLDRNWEERADRAVLWAWNPKTDDIQCKNVRSKVWLLRNSVDADEVSVDESNLDHSEVAIHNLKSGRLARIAIDKDDLGTIPFDSNVNDPRDFFDSVTQPSGLIVVRKEECSITCIDTEADRGIRWELSKERLASEIGSQPSGIYRVASSLRQSAMFHVLVNGARTGETYYLRIDGKDGSIQQRLKLDLERMSVSIYSQQATVADDGRSLAIINSSQGEKQIRIIDLTRLGQQIDMPKSEVMWRPWSSLEIVGIVDNQSLIVECGSAFWSVDLKTGRKRRKLFGLPEEIEPQAVNSK